MSEHSVVTTLNTLFPEFLDNLGGRKSRRNRELYQGRLHVFLQLFGDMPVAEINGGHVAEWHEILLDRGYAPATMAGYRQAVKSLFNYCVEEDVIGRSPARRLKVGTTLSRKRKVPPRHHLDEAKRLATEWMNLGRGNQVRDGVIFLLCTTCGLRAQEVRKLKLSHVKRALELGPDSYGVYAAASDGKTEEALARWNEQVAVGLRRYINEFRPKSATVDVCFIPSKRTRTKKDRELRWRMFSRSSLDNVFVGLCEAAGVPAIRPHTLRHEVGTRVTREHDAKTAARILNHRDWRTAATAIRYYVHTDESDIGAAIAPQFGTADDAEVREMSAFFGISP